MHQSMRQSMKRISRYSQEHRLLKKTMSIFLDILFHIYFITITITMGTEHDKN